MSANNAQAIALLQQAIALLGGGQAQAGYSVPAASAAPAAQGAVDYSLSMPFGKYKDWPLKAIATQGEEGIRYLKWVVDKFGRDDNGMEDPKYAAKNANFRATAAALLAGGAAPAPAPAAPAYQAPPQQPIYPPVAPQPVAEVYGNPAQQAVAQLGAQPVGEYAGPPSAGEPPIDEDIPF